MELLVLSLVGGMLALDATSVGQFMVSRPLVAGAVAGWVLGDAATGLLVGSILELYLLVSFPSGGARFPEGATAAVVAAATGVWGGDAPAAIPLAVAVGLLWGQVGGVSISALRRLNGRLAPAGASVSAATVVRAHVAGLAMDLGRGTLVTWVGLLVGRTVAGSFGGWWFLGADESSALLLAGGAVSAGVLLRSLGGFRRRRTLFVAGMALGLISARLF
jgi:mannose/fructose/N-acetylgalactosamine-specific phosphotransferase system component IIC